MLRIEKVTKNFGGLAALEEVSFSIRKGSITGIYPLTSGTIFLDDKITSAFPPEKLARLGLVRTFQNIELFGQMTVLENVMVGLHTRTGSGIISCALKLPSHLREERSTREKARLWLDYCGIADSADAVASNLPFGKGRLLEIARALALEPRIILMDEPAAGLNTRETSHLAELIRKIRESGVTVVLVEHDMELIMDICDSILVLDLGRKLAEGTPREIQENPAVIAAYLGAE